MYVCTWWGYITRAWCAHALSRATIYAPFISKYTHTYAYISQVRELLHDLMVIALGGGGGDWVERLADSSARSSRKVDLPMLDP